MSRLWERPAVRLAAIVALQFLILLSVIAFKQYTIWTGETVLLKTTPVDPRDLIRGDYVDLRYEISRLDTRVLAGDDWVSGDVYVELREGSDGYWEAVAIHDSRQRSFDGTVLIKGRVRYETYGGGRTIYDLTFGIEHVFIPEGAGAELPFGDDHDVAIEVKIDRFGNAIPRGFVVDGEPYPLRRR